jgi:hypothetical protein
MSTPIIDYASPASRASLRLPARSEIRWATAPGRLIITQVLSGREGAIGALLLAGFTFVIMTISIHGMIGKWHRFIAEIAIMSVFMAAELVVGALVIQNTWRKTILTVTPAKLTLEFAAPFTARQKFVFPSEQVAAVVVVDREPLPGEAVVAELEIRMWSIPPVRLFAGHPHQTLMTIAAAIGQIQPMAPPPLPGANAQPPADVAPPALVAPAPAPTPPAATPSPANPQPPDAPPAPPGEREPGFTVNL